MNSENNTEDASRNGRRSTDDSEAKEGFSPSGNSFRSRLFTWFLAFGGVAALIAVGRASHTLDTAVADNLLQDVRIEKIWERMAKDDIEQNRILVVLENQVQQQIKSDKEFLKVIEPINNKLQNIDNGVRQNRESFLIINQKMSAIDNTNVICMR